MAVCAALKALAALLIIAFAPVPFGMPVGFQFATLSQVPPFAKVHTSDPVEAVVTFRVATELVTLPDELLATTM